MKKQLFFFLVAAMFTACQKDDFLEPKTNILAEANVFTDSTRTMGFLGRIYGDISYAYNKGRWNGTSSTEVATDDAEFRYSGTGQPAVQLYNGSISPLNFNVAESYDVPWRNIRRVNLFLQKLPDAPLSGRLKARAAAEARFLRAWYYQTMLNHFGGMPLVGDKVYAPDEVIDLPRNTYAECVDYVVSELDAAAKVLPVEYTEQDYGRVTVGACLALKSRLLLQAASPLFNGESEAKNPELQKIVSYPTASLSHWQAAADAAQAVITMAGKPYELNMGSNPNTPGLGFYEVFLKRVNKEYIIFVNRGSQREYENYYNPPSRGGQYNSMPTQNIVDCFPMKNGKAITDPTSGFDPKNPYDKRDPRFDYTIIYNMSRYANANSGLQPVYTYEGSGGDGYVGNSFTTGYYCRKMCDVNIAQNGSSNTTRGWPLLRYAEILLNYAEAINETGNQAAALAVLKQIRQRAGIEAGTDGNYGLKAGMSLPEMREVVRNERRIELAYEDHRWNDIRRWKIAMVVANAYNKRMRIVQASPAATPTAYEVTESIRRHNFRPEMYLLPIPDSEIRKVPSMVQNPGW
ncbi:MAG TPA: RagB/SusD family nutrient uptake outer membrane protein [Hymenobacter sp.]|jgi:hypothetical protein|uniref:RagB/SusD family nutrient uptake outer membrane protein n=1 Tax=Hymenobacter sp. TaxID=1898978 RepID=UPI002ED8A2DB